MRTLIACGVVALSAVAGRSSIAVATPPKVACTLLTPTQVTAALGVGVGAGKPMTKEVCQWSEPGKGNDPVKLELSLTTLDRYNKFKAARNAAITPVAQLGDDAYYSIQNANNLQVALCVKKGETTVIIHAFGGKKTTADYQSMEKAIAEAVLPAL